MIKLSSRARLFPRILEEPIFNVIRSLRPDPIVWSKLGPREVLVFCAFKGGGIEAEPVIGRLGSVERMAKPTARSVLFFGGAYSQRSACWNVGVPM